MIINQCMSRFTMRLIYLMWSIYMFEKYKIIILKSTNDEKKKFDRSPTDFIKVEFLQYLLRIWVLLIYDIPDLWLVL